jgi:hypothetical protein
VYNYLLFAWNKFHRTPSNPNEPIPKNEDIKSTEPIKIDKRFKEANENFKDVNKNPL